ncbi:MAG: HlyD family efflux transporter periplasmic adaptor subunit [Blastomonas sp.]
MNRKMLAIPIILLLAIAAWAGWRWLSPSEEEIWLGYVEGEALYIAAPVSGTLGERNVERGDTVTSGDRLFSLDPASLDADVDRLKADVAASMAQMRDLEQQGRRPAEQDISRAAIASAQAQLTKAQHDFDRISALADKGFASRTQLDAARAARDRARADLAQANAQLRSGALSAGRSGQIAAAGASVAGAEAALRAQQQRRAEIAPLSPADGLVEQTFFNPGEWVPANTPVVAVLPDDRRKLRFFVPQDAIASLKPGMKIAFSCDGCPAGQSATISYIAPRAEFTPPVIYSETARAKLVFMVEARLAKSGQPLPPGLPVDIMPPDRQ